MRVADCGFHNDPLLSGTEKLVRTGPTLFVNIVLDPEYRYAESEPTFNSDIIQVPALIDTGAMYSFIDGCVAQSLNLPLVDRRIFCLLTGKYELNGFVEHVVIPALSFFQHGIFYGFPNDNHELYQAILGRTFLQHMMLNYDGRTGSVQITKETELLELTGGTQQKTRQEAAQ